MKRFVVVSVFARQRAIALGLLASAALLSVAVAGEPDGDPFQATGDGMVSLFKAGLFEEAAEAAKIHTATLENAYGQGAHETAVGYAYQAKAYAEAGNNLQARRARDAAIVILSTTNGRDRSSTALTLFGLALVSDMIKDPTTATTLAVNAAGLWQRGDSDVPPALETLLFDLAGVAANQGRLWQVDELYELGLWATTKTFGQDSLQRLERLVSVGNHYEALGRFAEAVTKHEAALGIIDKGVDARSPVRAECLLQVAVCRELLGEFAKAESLARQAREILLETQGTHEVQTGDASAIIARSCARQGKWEQAEQSARQAISTLKTAAGAKTIDLTDAYLALSLVYSQQNRYEEAEKIILESLTLAKRSDNNGKTEALPGLAALATILWSAGKHEEADAVFREATAACDKKLGADSPAAAAIRASHAANYFYQGRHKEADKLLTHALSMLRPAQGDNHFQSARLNINLATVQAAQGAWGLAAEHNDLGMHGLILHIRSQLATLPPLEQMRLLRGQYAIGYQAAMTMGLLQRADSRIRKLSAGWLANGKAIAHDASAWQASQERDGTGDSARASRPKSTDGPSHWVDIESIRLCVPRNAVFIDIARFDIFNYAAKRKGEDWQPARYAAWIVPPPGAGEIEVIDLGEAKPLDAAVTEYRAVIRAALGKQGLITKAGEPAAEKALREAASPLTEQIIRPLLTGVEAAGCAETAKEFIISPDGELWLVPWSAIPMPDGRYLVEKCAISTVTSGRDLARSRGAPLPTSVPVIFADPAFDLPNSSLTTAVKRADAEREAAMTSNTRAVATSASLTRSVSEVGRVERLPGSAIEAALVAERIERLTNEKPITFLQRRAIEERVKEVRSPRILHFATHGFALPDQVSSAARVESMSALSAGGRHIQGLTSEAGDPLEDPLLRCGLLLTGCNTAAVERPEGIEDGCLTAKEILSLDLSGTELVVLSACDTGLGRVQYGEGVAGLRQAFLIAGAESVLASLWQVPDTPTVDLVAGFFDHLDSGNSKASALRKAQLDLLERRRKVNGAAHPALWGAFELTGR